MTNPIDVLRYLIPQGGWSIAGESFEDITFIECEPITKELFDTTMIDFDSIMSAKDAAQATAKAALLARLGITAEEATLLLS
jgi:hypothetical protein